MLRVSREHGALSVLRVPRRRRRFALLERIAYAFRDPAVSLPGAFLVLVIFLCFAGPSIFGLPDPNVGSFKEVLKPIGTPGHLLGTNNLGNDMLSRLLHGGQVSLMVGFISTAISLGVGVVLGCIAGLYGRSVDIVISRIFDMLFAFPGLILALAIAAYLGPSVWHTIFAISFFAIAGFGRLARAQTLRIRSVDYVIAAKTSGASTTRLVLFHVVPNIIPPLTSFAMFGVGVAMVAEAGLSYLGLGIQIPQASWGNLIANSHDYLSSDPALLVIPAALLFLTVLSVNLLADALRRRLQLDR